MQVYISSDEINNILVLSDEPENINSKILSYYWNIIPSVIDAGMTPNKLRAFLKDAASSRAMCIGPSALQWRQVFAAQDTKVYILQKKPYAKQSKGQGIF